MDYAVFSTSLGWMAVVGSPRGIARVVLPTTDPVDCLDSMCVKVRAAPSQMRRVEAQDFGTLPDRLTAFIRGENVCFEDELDRSTWSDFRTRVWDATRTIPYGETRSYAWVAAAAGQPLAARAAGQALHNNPVPIIVPCHRVIGAGGDLVGFGSGLALKRLLLSLESGRLPASGN